MFFYFLRCLRRVRGEVRLRDCFDSLLIWGGFSGAEDKHGYLWDRHYGICLAKFPHTDVVNSVAFNPKDPEMLVTTSDDQKIKVWRSRAKIKQLGLNRNDFQEGVELRIGRNKKTT